MAVYYQHIAGRIYGGVARRDPSALVHATLGRLQAPSLASYLAQLYTVAGWSSLPWLHTLRQPTLVLAGDDDPIVPLINARILAWRIPDASLHVVRGGGHLFVLERPAAVAEVVTAFLDEPPSGKTGRPSS